LEISEAASEDAAAAAEFYESRRRGLGDAFLATLDALFEHILEHPMRYRVVRGSWRRALLPRFPYSVIYRVEPDRIFVLAIMHGRRDPNVWQRRRT
jgi:plasmid stabilization system protein ParE